jgi:hypothetical protein
MTFTPEKFGQQLAKRMINQIPHEALRARLERITHSTGSAKDQYGEIEEYCETEWPLVANKVPTRIRSDPDALQDLKYNAAGSCAWALITSKFFPKELT